jgi:hypothetical protein
MIHEQKVNKQESTFNTVDSHYVSDFTHGDTVKRYKEGTQMVYPYLLMECATLDKFRVDTLIGVLGNRSLLPDILSYNVYVKLGSQVVEVGRLPSNRLKIILESKTFDVFTKSVSREDGDSVEGDMLYALCTTTTF